MVYYTYDVDDRILWNGVDDVDYVSSIVALTEVDGKPAYEIHHQNRDENPILLESQIIGRPY